MTIVETIQQAIYGKSSNPFAKENIHDLDFQDGYRKGEEDAGKVEKFFHSDDWVYAWRILYAETYSEGWENWKRGYHAGKLSAITLK